MKKSLLFGVAVALAGVAVLALSPRTSEAAKDVARTEARWTFDLSHVVRGGGDAAADGTARMYGFVFDVDALGTPSLVHAYDLPGEAPPYHELPDLGRIYRWVLRDARGKVLAEGRHFDALSVRSPEPEAPCVHAALGPHAVGIRTPHPADASVIELSIERTVGDAMETR